jgi:ubiquinone/menaquinone biosynthesis C-methylase UbiE
MQVNELYDSVADEYEELINSPKVNAKLVFNLKKIFDKYKITQGSILDLGCGPGNLKTTLGGNFSYTGVDISEKMLNMAEKKGYKIINGKIEEELKKMPDKSFDYIVSLSAIYFIEDIKFVISELDRVSKKGWLISLADITESYAKYFSIYAPLYNHTKLVIPNLQEDITFVAWTSPRSGEQMKERMIFIK